MGAFEAAADSSLIFTLTATVTGTGTAKGTGTGTGSYHFHFHCRLCRSLLIDFQSIASIMQPRTAPASGLRNADADDDDDDDSASAP